MALNGVLINVITPIRYALPIVYLALTADHLNESREYVVDHLWWVYYIYLFIKFLPLLFINFNYFWVYLFIKKNHKITNFLLLLFF